MHGLEQIAGGAHAHQISGPIARQQLSHGGRAIFALGVALADRKTADGVAVEGHFGDGAGALDAQDPGISRLARCRTALAAESPRAVRLRRAQRWVNSIAPRATSWSTVDGTHWSSTIMMSEPIAFCTSMLRSGLKRTGVLST